ncbi:hypothetical protein AAF712_015504 [Marasmius tenuissimus]|uniref:Uncharacterized protein n=1 Tax=Marasmius tenuissimus TaxID=585030 RepID=A0ABR2ZAC2_9AGAR
MFAISSFEFWADAVVIMTSMKNVFVDNVGTSFIEKQSVFAEKYTLLVSVQEVLVPLEIIIGDAIIFWRVWVLCAGDKELVSVPFIFLLGTTVCLLGFFSCFAQNDWPVANLETCNALVVSGYSLSLVTNIAGTVAIGVQVWIYKRTVRAYLTAYKECHAEKILILLLESGVVYSLVWVVQLVVVHIPPAATLSGKVVQQILKAGNVQLVGIYPTALVVLIYLQQSMWDSSGNSTIVGHSTNRDHGQGSSQTAIFKKHQA